MIFLRSVALHIGRYYNIKEQTPRKIPYNEVLEQAFRKHGKTFPLPDIAKVRQKIFIQVNYSESYR